MLSAYHDQLINIRRQLHQNPEEGWSEFTTTAFLVTTLRGYGYDVLTGRKVVAPEACLGREESVVKAGLEHVRNNQNPIRIFLELLRIFASGNPFIVADVNAGSCPLYLCSPEKATIVLYGLCLSASHLLIA